MKIVLTGASGLIGKALLPKLILAGHEVRVLVRKPETFHDLPPKSVFAWTTDGFPPVEALRCADAVVHLAGEPVAGARWNPAVKERIENSRVLGTRRLVQGLAQLNHQERPKILLSGSAIGIYGDRGDDELTESAKAGKDFLAKVCVAWEKEANVALDLGMRVVLLRTSIVLAREGGALGKMAPVVLGDGKQWMSWIHIDDETRFIEFALNKSDVSGAFNLAAPEAVTNREFTRAFAHAVRVPFTGLGVPKLALKAGVGEMASALLASQRVKPTRALKAGFQFNHPKLDAALEDLYGTDGLLDQRLTAHQFVARPLPEVFEFFSRAENLEQITPEFLSFKIKSVSTETMQEGTLIDYRLSIHGVPVGWRTRIEKWVPGQEFVDIQLKGPYQKWHHRHTFKPVLGGTLVTDQITYRVPGWLPGKLALGAWVGSDVNKIFRYRGETIRKLFAEHPL